MKKFLFTILVSLSLVAGAAAQGLPNNPVTVTPTKTSLVNADASVATAPSVKSYYRTFVFTATITKNSGTLAGTVTFSGSLDGTVFYPITVTSLTDGTNNLAYREAGSAFNQYRISIATTGTSTSTVSNVKYLYKADR